MIVAALVLAAGRSTRMGEANKLLLPVHDRPLVVRVVEAVLASRAAPVVVVTGYQGEAVEEALAGFPVRFARNSGEGEGLSSSLRRGLAVLPEEVDGALVCLGDMPGVSAVHLDALIAGFAPASGHDVCAPVHGGRRGNPVLWGRRHFPALRALTGDAGGRELLERATVHPVQVADDGVLRDIDDPRAYAEWVKAFPEPERAW
ncbi:MAG: nucleotidyltransferase family protein [Alphaproteobacteria bacterium]|nr:nucleotidyltransferase family protein [Alphaproteobacteria bacterium]